MKYRVYAQLKIFIFSVFNFWGSSPGTSHKDFSIKSSAVEKEKHVEPEKGSESITMSTNIWGQDPSVMIMPVFKAEQITRRGKMDSEHLVEILWTIPLILRTYPTPFSGL